MQLIISVAIGIGVLLIIQYIGFVAKIIAIETDVLHVDCDGTGSFDCLVLIQRLFKRHCNVNIIDCFNLTSNHCLFVFSIDDFIFCLLNNKQ